MASSQPTSQLLCWSTPNEIMVLNSAKNEPAFQALNIYGSTYECSSRLINVFHGLFMRVQQERIPKKEIISIASQYRKAVQEELQAVLPVEFNARFGHNSVEGESKVEMEKLVNLQQIDFLLCLTDSFFLQPSSSGELLNKLLTWKESSTLFASRTFAREIAQLDNPASSEFYWQMIILCLLDTNFSDAISLLHLHSDSASEHFTSFIELLQAMPSYGSFVNDKQPLRNFTNRWRTWHAECVRRYSSGVYLVNDELHRICSMICGDESMLVSLARDCHSWYDYMIIKLLFTNPFVSPTELLAFAQICMSEYGKETPSVFDEVVILCLEFNVLGMIRLLSSEMSPASSSWFACHLVDLLFHFDKPRKKHYTPDFQIDCDFRESLVIDYASSLLSKDQYWQHGVNYLKACPKSGRSLLTSYLPRVPIHCDQKALKVISICKSLNMHFEAQTVCKVMATQALKLDQLSAALRWCFLSADTVLASKVADRLFHQLERSGDFDNLQVLDTVLDSEIPNSDSLAFLFKYREMEKLRSVGRLEEAANILTSLITSRLAPKKFWLKLLTESLYFMEMGPVNLEEERRLDLMTLSGGGGGGPRGSMGDRKGGATAAAAAVSSFSTGGDVANSELLITEDFTYDLLHCLEDLQFEIDHCNFNLETKDMSREEAKEQIIKLRRALAKNLTLAISMRRVRPEDRPTIAATDQSLFNQTNMVDNDRQQLQLDHNVPMTNGHNEYDLSTSRISFAPGFDPSFSPSIGFQVHSATMSP